MAWDAIGQFQILPEPRLFGFPKYLHIGESLATTDKGAYGDKEDVREQVLLGPVDPWVRQNRKVGKEISRVTHR